MKNSDQLSDLRSTCFELKASIIRKLTVPHGQDKLATILNKETDILSNEVAAQFNMIEMDHEKGQVSELIYRRSIGILKELFENRKFNKHVSSSLKEIEFKIANKIAF